MVWHIVQKDRQVTVLSQYLLPQNLSMSDKNISGTVAGGDVVGAAGAEREARLA